MKKLISIMTVIMLVLTFTIIPANAAGNDLKVIDTLGKSKAEYVPNEIIVKYHNDSKPFRKITVPDGTVAEKVKEYSKMSNVEYAEPNYIAHAFMVPTDPYYKYQWNLKNQVEGGIELEKVWDVTAGNADVIVAVIDTGIAYENYGSYYKAPDLANTSFKAGKDFVNNDLHANDDNSHGTHVAGTIAQSTNNLIGTAGAAFGVTLMPVKVLSKSGSGTYDAIASGIRFAADNGAKVINMSLGGPTDAAVLEDAVLYAHNKGVTIVAAAGNDGTGTVSYPAACDNVIAVGATGYGGYLAPYSNYGAALDVVAPGGDTSVDLNGDGKGDGILQNTFNPTTKNTSSFGYYFFQGTSMASPHVAAAAALVISAGVASDPVDVEAVLENTAVDLGDPNCGHGLINVAAALGVGDTGDTVNNPPVVQSIDKVVKKNKTAKITLSGSDADGDALTYEIVTNPSHGKVVVNGNIAAYTPDTAYVGKDFFTYRASDGELYSEAAAVNLTIK